MTMPKVSAIMITGKTEGRERLVRAAINSFGAQTYPNRELIIVNDGKPLLVADWQVPKDIPISEYKLEKKHTLGELRNFGLRIADGDYIIQWDDDDFSHPERITYQMKYARPGKAVLFRYQIRYSFISNSALCWKWNYASSPGIPGTVLHGRVKGMEYRSLGKKEDEYFLSDYFKDNTVVIDNCPAIGTSHYYIRLFHGNQINTWDERHIMGRIEKDRWDLDEIQKTYLKSVLAANYLTPRLTI